MSKELREHWVCENPKCLTCYAEYVNGCPKCATGEVGGSHSVKPALNRTALIQEIKVWAKEKSYWKFNGDGSETQIVSLEDLLKELDLIKEK